MLNCRRYLSPFTKDGGNDLVLTARAIILCLQQLRGEVKQHRKLEEAEVKEVPTQQLEYLSAGPRSLEDALKRKSKL
jgi:hypothetical protein